MPIRSAMRDCPRNSTFLSQIQHPQVSRLSEAVPGPSKTIATSDVRSDPRTSGYTRRLGSLAGRRRKSSLVTLPLDLPDA